MIKHTCSIDGCEQKHYARGWCASHYNRWRKTGEPLAMTSEELFWARVNKSGPVPEHRPDLGPCWEWTATRSKGYGWVKMNGKGQSTHRASWQFLVGPIPPKMKLDHQCHNRACVNPDHLRVATHKQNLEHLAGAQKNSKSGIRGVSWDKRRNNWEASEKHNGKGYHVGNFRDIADAEAAVIAKRNELFTHNDADRMATS